MLALYSVNLFMIKLKKMTSRLITFQFLSLPMIYGTQLSPDVCYRYESIAREISVYVSPSSTSEEKDG